MPFARVLLSAALATISPSVAAQTVPTGPEPAIAAAAAEQADVQAGPPVTLTYANRPIVEFRASVFGRPPAARVAAARVALDRLVDAGITGPVESRPIDALIAIGVGGRDIFLILPSDVDSLAGATLTETAALAASRLQIALNEAAELRRPRQMLVGVLAVLLATALFIVLVWLLRKARWRPAGGSADATKQRLNATAVGDAEFVRASRIVEFLDRIVLVLTGPWPSFSPIPGSRSGYGASRTRGRGASRSASSSWACCRRRAPRYCRRSRGCSRSC